MVSLSIDYNMVDLCWRGGGGGGVHIKNMLSKNWGGCLTKGDLQFTLMLIITHGSRQSFRHQTYRNNITVNKPYCIKHVHGI